MSSPHYVWEKMYVAVDCLCGDGPFINRLKNATVSALMRLEDDDLAGELAEDLKFILGWTKKNVVEWREPNELERRELIEKMLHVMLETHRR